MKVFNGIFHGYKMNLGKGDKLYCAQEVMEEWIEFH